MTEFILVLFYLALIAGVVFLTVWLFAFALGLTMLKALALTVALGLAVGGSSR